MESNQYANLTQHRSDVDAWTPRGYWDRVANNQTALSLASLAGIAMALYGVTRRRSGPGRWWLVSGAVLGGVAASVGNRHWLSNFRVRPERPSGDVVTLESLDSFPASDAPSSNAATATVLPDTERFRTD